MEEQTICSQSRLSSQRLTAHGYFARFLMNRRDVVVGFVVGLVLFVGWVHSSCVVGGECRFDVDCLDDQICLNTVCTKYSDDGGTQKQGCRYDQDCPSDQICYVGTCRATAALFENSSQEILQAEQLTQQPDQIVTTEDVTPTEQAVGNDSSVSDSSPVPVLGLPPGLHGLSAGSSFSTSPSSKHMVIVGPTTPLVPSATVMRSANYSMRPGVVSTTLW